MLNADMSCGIKLLVPQLISKQVNYKSSADNIAYVTFESPYIITKILKCDIQHS